MNLRKLGATQLQVSPLGFGCSRIGGMSALGARRQDTLRLLHAAVERGLNFFDTSDAYASGDSERLLGEAFEHKRAKVVLATKGGYVFEDEPIAGGVLNSTLGLLRKAGRKARSRLLPNQGPFSQQDFSPKYLSEALEASLRRLRTDAVDLYQLHAPRTAQAQSDDAIDALLRLRSAGKLRYIGVGLESLADVEHWLEFDSVDVIQLPYGLLDLEASSEALPLAARLDRAVVARGVFGGGLLKESLDGAALRKLTPKWRRIEEFRSIARAADRTIHELALHYVLQTPGVSTVLLGMHNIDHLDSNLALLERGPLDPGVIAAIDGVNARIALET